MKILENQEDDNQWLPISDLMTVLMSVFLIISIIFLIQIKSGANKYLKLKKLIASEMEEEFKDKNWDGYEIDKENLSIKFVSPKILFDFEKSEIKPEFKKILNDFFPSFINILSKESFASQIDEIIIEGHTSREKDNRSEDERYFYNLGLSQERARNVLVYSLSKTLANNPNKKWAREKLTATGYSFNKLYIADSVVNNRKSKRVEFRIKLNADLIINKIANQ